MKKITHIAVLAAVLLMARCRCEAQSNVYSVAIYAGGTSYRELCSFDFPFPPYHFSITERSWYEDVNGLTIIDVGREKARGGTLRRSLDVELGSEHFSIPIEPVPVKIADTKSPNHSMDRTADSVADLSLAGMWKRRLHFARASSAVGHVNRSAKFNATGQVER